MIEFPCKCGYELKLPEDLAGGVVQCPRCRRLVDIPTPTQMKEMDADGTIKMGDALPPDPEREEQIKWAYTARDDEGNERDIRGEGPDEWLGHPEEIPLAGDAEKPRPKYDPETGELIRPVEVAPEKAVPVIPLGPHEADQGKTLHYARPEAAGMTMERHHWPPIALLAGGNLVVLLMVFMGHLFINLLFIPAFMGLFIVVVLPFVLLIAVIAHYANVVEETAVYEQNELPVPMRQVSLGEDICWPFVRVTLSLLACYGLAAWLLLCRMPFSALVAAAAGTIVFPAVFLSATTGGTIVNLRPDRVLGVMRACGLGYVLSILLWAVAAPIYFGVVYQTIALSSLAGTGLIGRMPTVDLMPAAVSYPLLFIAIYAMHLFCLHLGLLYRGHHEQFPWLFQRHITKEERRVERRKPRYVDKGPAAQAQPAENPATAPRPPRPAAGRRSSRPGA